MGSALLIALCGLLSAVSAGLAWAHVRRVAAITAVDARDLATSLRRKPEPERAAELARRAPTGSWEQRLAEDLASAPGDGARVAAINDALAEVEQTLDAGRGWPPAALRISALAGLLLGAVAYLTGRPDAILPTIGLGIAGALASAGAGRRARHLARSQREAIDALIRAAAGTALAFDGAEARGRARRKWRSV